MKRPRPKPNLTIASDAVNKDTGPETVVTKTQQNQRNKAEAPVINVSIARVTDIGPKNAHLAEDKTTEVLSATAATDQATKLTTVGVMREMAAEITEMAEISEMAGTDKDHHKEEAITT